ncbi:hypothetical protein ACF0H5_000030 [Mactra antiquata]
MENAVLLSGTRIGVSRDYPREIREARKELWQDFKDARKVHGKSRVQWRYPAALVINGQTVRDHFPGLHEILRQSRNSDITSRVEVIYKSNVQKSLPKNSTKYDFAPRVVEPDILEEQSSDGDSDSEPDISHFTKDVNDVTAMDEPTTDNAQPCTQQGYLLNVHPPISDVKLNQHKKATTGTTKGKASKNQHIKSSAINKNINPNPSDVIPTPASDD